MQGGTESLLFHFVCTCVTIWPLETWSPITMGFSFHLLFYISIYKIAHSEGAGRRGNQKRVWLSLGCPLAL